MRFYKTRGHVLKKHTFVLLAFLIIIPFNSLNSQDWQPAELLDVTQCELSDGSIVPVASNAQIGPGVGVERLDLNTYRVYFASDDIPTVQSPGQYDLYYVDFDIPSRSWGMAHSIDLICETPLNSSSHDEQPRVSPDGQYLFYAQLGSGGSHDHEIWIAEKNNSGLWSNFRKLPPEVNAGYDEHSGGFRDGVLRFSAKNRNSNSGVFELWECDYDPVSNSASNPRKILFGTCPDQDQSSDPADTTIQHDALVDNSNDAFQWAEHGINWNSADDGYISYATGSWDAAVVSNVMFNPDDNPVMIFRIYRGTSSNHMAGFSNTGPSSTSFHYSDLDYGIYIHSTGSIRPTWNVNDSGYWSTTLPVGYYDIRVMLDGTNQSVSIAVEQVSDYYSPQSDFQSPYWSTVESRSLDNSCYIQLNVGNAYTRIYDVWSTTGIAAPVTPAAMAGTDAWVIPDGSQLYFKSYLQPDAAGSDIYYSNKIECPEGGYYWSNPIRMSDNVNGSGQEGNPTPTEDMRFLFFSSTSGPANGYNKTLFCEAVLPLADLAGTVSIDDGVTSTPAEGVVLDLYRFTGTDFEFITSTTSGTDGQYTFADYEPDSYRVEMNVPEGYETSTDSQDAALAGVDITDLDFILNPLADISGSIAVMGSAPVAGHTLTLSLYDGTEYQYLDQTVTDSIGAYSFEDIVPGEYCVAPDSLAGHALSPDVHYISLGRVDTSGVDFCFVPPADIAGTVSIDGSGAAQGVT
ncbi:MAG: hypothetical protein GF417_05580, partial [Candidatus Latescibacteria bacterium]|nr:hypothetical protein [Candidatus Latescibacterota bacterium]